MTTHMPFDLKVPPLGFNSTDILTHMANFFVFLIAFFQGVSIQHDSDEEEAVFGILSRP